MHKLLIILLLSIPSLIKCQEINQNYNEFGNERFLTPYKENNKWGYKYNDEVIVNPQFDYATNFVGDFAIIGNYSKNGNVLNMGILKNLTLICPFILTSVGFYDKKIDNSENEFYFVFQNKTKKLYGTL